MRSDGFTLLKCSELRDAGGKFATFLCRIGGLSTGSGISSTGVVTMMVIGMLAELWNIVADISFRQFVELGSSTGYSEASLKLYSESVYSPESFWEEVEESLASNSARAFLRSSSKDSSKLGVGNGGGLSGSNESFHIFVGTDMLYSDFRSNVGRGLEFKNRGGVCGDCS